MATNTKFQDCRAAIKTAVEAQWTTDVLTAVFNTYPLLGDNVTREDRMMLRDVSFTQEPYTYGNYQETLGVEFVVSCPASGNTEDEWDDAVGRAEALLDSALTTLRNDITIGGTVFNVELGETDNTTATVDELGPYGIIDGTLELEAHV